MPEEPANGWPRFELVTFPEPTGFPRELAAPLLGKGAPKSLLGQGYQAADSLTLLDAPPFGRFVRFASDDVTDDMCLDPRTGQVVVITHVPGTPPWLVNSSLEQFIESVRFVIGRFPFDAGFSVEERDVNSHAFDSRWDRVVDELAEALRRIDPVAFSDEDSYWREFIESVQMGNYTTKFVVDEGDG